MKRISGRLDIIAAALGVLFGLLIIYLYFKIHLRQSGIGIVIVSSSLMYLLLRSKFKLTELGTLKINRRQKLLLNIIFFVFYSISLMLWHNQINLRPLSYFMLISFLVGIISIEIIYSNEKSFDFLAFLKIIFLSLNIRIGLLYNFPSIMGYDAYSHAKIAELMTGNGFVLPAVVTDRYHYYPILHIFIDITKIIDNINIKDALFFSIGLENIIITLFVYLISWMVAGKRIGLISVLLLNIAPEYIVAGIANITPSSLVLCYLMIVIYLIFDERKNVESRIIMIFLSGLIIISHQLSAFVTLIIFILIYISKYLYANLFDNKDEKKIDLNFSFILLFSIAMLSYWMNTYIYSANYARISFFDWILRNLINTFRFGRFYGSNSLIVGYDYSRPILDTLILNIDYLILPFLVIGGVLYWLSQRNSRKFAFSFEIIILYSIIYGVAAVGIRNLLTDRWIPFLLIFSVVAASTNIFKILEQIKPKNRAIFIFITMVFISFFLITTPSINKDNPLVSRDTTIRNQFTDSEIYGVKTVPSHFNGPYRIDSLFFQALLFYGTDMNQSSFINIKSNTKIIDLDYIQAKKLDEKGTMIILRKLGPDDPISVKSSDLFGDERAFSVPEDFFGRFNSLFYYLTYNNGKVKHYLLN